MKHGLFKNSLGMSMMEVMMAVAITGGLALTIAKLLENSSQNVKQIEAKSESISLKNIITSNFTTPAACFNTFNPVINAANLTTLSGSTSASVTVGSIKDKANNTLYDVNSTNIKPLTITGMVLTNYSSTNKNGDLIVSLSFRRSASQVQQVKPIRIKVNFNINASNALVGCSPMESGTGEWLLAGNAGTTDGTEFIGTTDNAPLNFKVNNIESGRIDSAGLTFFGYQAGSSNTTGTMNSIFGRNAGMMLSTGSYNTILGAGAGSALGTGSSNIFIGPSAGVTLGEVSNKLAIEGIPGNNPLISGDFSSKRVTIDGSLSIGTSTPGTPSSVMPVPATPVVMHIRGAVIIDQTPWLDVSLSASAASGAGSWMKCRVDSAGNVHLKGYINKIATSTSSSNQSLGTLPIECRPRSVADGTSAANAYRVGNAFDQSNGTKYCFHISGAPGDAYWDGRLQATACDSTQGTAWGGSAFDQTWWPLARTLYIPEIIYSKLQ